MNQRIAVIVVCALALSFLGRVNSFGQNESKYEPLEKRFNEQK